MQLTYIFHSGFVLETDRCILVFDYWMDPAGVMPRLLQSPKPLYVFSSHFHEDHFNRDIFSWQTRKANVRYILSKDILKYRRAQKEEADAWLGKGATWEDELLRVTATGSNDSGVSWVIETDGKRIFHAGDLNNWYARFLTDDYHGGLVYSPDFGIDINPVKEEKRFLGELKDIRKFTDRFDVVMFPVDGRIGNGYTRGARQFLDVFRTGLFVPMHFVASGFESAWRMKEFTDAKSVPFWCIRREGECCEVKKHIEVVAAVMVRDGKYFATQRGYGEFKDYWEFPGGKVEPGESREEALVREIREELDTDIRVDAFLTTVNCEYPSFHLTMHCYRCSVVSGSLVLKEHKSAAWLRLEELDSVAWLPADVEVVKEIIAQASR